MKRFGVKVFLLSAVALLICNLAKSQSFADNALLFGRTRPGGSARIQALGGAQVSLGGDFSSALSNPAGLGMYNHSEFTFTPGYNTLNTTTNFLGNSLPNSKSTFNIPGASLVFHSASDKEEGFLGGSFGITMTRTNDLNQSYSYQGSNSKSSMIDYFIQNSYDANGNALDPNSMLIDNSGIPGSNFYSLPALAYNNFLTDTISTKINNQKVYDYISPLSPLVGETRTEIQRETLQRKGAQYQWSIAYGANFSDKLFIGASLGITTLNYKLSTSFTESNFGFSTDATYKPLDNFHVDETLNIQGSGLNFTAGLIYRPVDVLQIGMSVVTPTYYQITDTYNANITSTWNNFDYYGDGTTIVNGTIQQGFDQPIISKYSLTTPFKFSTGATYFIGKYGFITGDLEFVNYSQAKYEDNTYSGISYDSDNSEIKSTYKSVINYRVGAEFRKDIFRGRLGFNVMADPYQQSYGVDRKIQSFSFGVGIKQSKFSLDLTAVSSKSTNTRQPYSYYVNDPKNPTNYTDIGPVAEFDLKSLNFVLTAGYTF